MTGIFISARLGSTRLLRKHFIKASDKTFIEWLAARFYTRFKEEIEKGEVGIYITTSVNPENKEFEELFKNSPVKVFYGSDENIPLRHLECAIANKIDFIISVDGDDILCSTSAAVMVMNKLKSGADMVQTSGLPLGMNVTGYRRSFLESALNNSEFVKLETGWGRIFDKSRIDILPIEGMEAGQKIRMTLDYKEDAAFFQAVIENRQADILEINDAELIDSILENKFNELNDNLNEEYWINFNKQKHAEK
jgi:spore coat polysaccharide biosynthesis protein SpsF